MRNRAARALAIPTALLAFTSLVITAPLAVADEPIEFHYAVDATAHLATLNQDVVVPQGTFDGSVIFESGEMTGHIKLPPSTFTMEVAGFGLVEITAKIVEVAPVTGHIDFFFHHPDITIEATSTVKLRILSAYAAGTPSNLVGTMCVTKTPFEVSMAGVMNRTGPTEMSGEFEIPQFNWCGNPILTNALNLLVSGPGNTFTARATPR